NAAFARLSRRYSGAVDRGNVWTEPFYPTVFFRHDDADVVVSVDKIRGVYFTVVRIDCWRPGLRVECRPNALWSFDQSFRAQNVRLGTDFDNRFTVRGNNPEDVRSFLSAPVQQQISLIQFVAGNEPVIVSMNGRELIVFRRGLLGDYQPLQRFVHDALVVRQLARRWELAGSDEIQIVDEPQSAGEQVIGSVIHAEAPVCQICGEGIEDLKVVCVSCQTPHHRDCWEYAGCCSMYGCGQSYFRATS
ncbi:MAG: hypothetical protein N2C14_01805, partial [Planctomycetales bacterium]